ncbi:DUF2804 domain-containing protein [Vibrio cyclitrophicus]|uniref:DUF2804 domain-containing protein n=1 Tax=Vibrio cyclitrophicus TaxID=47951 RepID=UPI0002EC796D|nr:DUF2804 domain-containing protein [Vibrio cyclitrophicus]MBU2933243.1 DUF2804 domain-containing protein [Vibrio cyclitrophicus]OBT14266.1 hypothetical protein A9265_04510 [Vibrio cyclitrophicus]OEF37038.1 hypothetical protein OA7_03015 [Vibrio cyclitrophicus 1F53]OEF66811.1 hypothetical protein OAA_07005 [Vibrio cyclitrophicus 1F175]PMH35364.1 hypothetical protein BCU72_09680 [Vibrio cyclitrophicus]
MIKTNPAPHSLIDSNGQPIIGHFDGIPKQLNIENFDYRSSMDSKAAPWQKHFHYKQFQFVSIVTDTHIIGVAIADIRYLGSAFCYLYDIESNKLEECSWLRPLGFDKHVTPSPFEGKTSIAGQSIAFDIKGKQWRVRLNTKLIKADVTLDPKIDSLPMAMCSPTGYSGWTYTQKHNAVRIIGDIQIKGTSLNLTQALAGYDFSAGYMRRETSWRWASINTQSNGTDIGLNLAAGVNETGGCENVLWVNGTRHLLNPVQFTFSRQDTNFPWQITSQDGRINLIFTPLNNRSEKLNLWLLKSNFRQFIGHFSGSIQDNDGITHQLDGVLGLTEDHFARW